MIVDIYGNPINIPEEPRWELFIERKFRDYYLGNITKEEYDLAEQYIKEKSTLDFREWLEKKNV